MFRFARTTPKFEAGQLICHIRYGYRGVVVAVDPECQANQAWYESNRTQPDLCQPWYHVLVHQSLHSTYVAERNLEPDKSASPIRHPMLDNFFSRFENGRYVNDGRIN